MVKQTYLLCIESCFLVRVECYENITDVRLQKKGIIIVQFYAFYTESICPEVLVFMFMIPIGLYMGMTCATCVSRHGLLAKKTSHAWKLACLSEGLYNPMDVTLNLFYN